MKIHLIALLIITAGSIITTRGQYFVNEGAAIVVTGGTFLHINGQFRNQNAGSLNNAGNVIVKGNWENNASSGNLLQGSTGTVSFSGNSSQLIGGTAKTWFNNLTLGNDVNLGAESSVSAALSMNDFLLTLNAFNLIMETGSSLTGYSSNGHVVTNGLGQLFRPVGVSNVIFPVGTGSAFVPVHIVNSGTIDNYGVSVIPGVKTNGLSGATLPQINNCVDVTWNITEQLAGGSNLTITAFWPGALEGAVFDRSKAGMGHYTGGTWNPQEESPAPGSNPYSMTRSGVTTLSAFAVGDLESPMAIPVDIRLDLTSFLEGPFNGSGMDTDLLSGGVIPLSQPYNQAPWFYGGTESVASIPPDVVDWALIEVRDAATPALATPATTVATKAVFVLSNGSLVDLNGSSLPSFTFTLSNQLFAVVWHRNHLGIMSANGLTSVGGIFTYDFTVSKGQAYLSGQKDLGGGYSGMFSGNGDGNLSVANADKEDIWDPETGTSGYKNGDFNLDTQVDNVDKNEHWNENSGSSSAVPD